MTRTEITQSILNFPHKGKLVGALFPFFATPLCAQTLTLEVRDIEQPTGHLYVAIYNNAESFLRTPAAAFRLEVDSTVVSAPCTGLPAGEYAISLFQDLNGNGQLDTGAFGIPSEPYGFSNDAKGVMGPPTYDQCVFTLRKDTTVAVRL